MSLFLNLKKVKTIRFLEESSTVLCVTLLSSDKF